MNQTAVLALGGNALTPPHQAGAWEEQRANAVPLARAAAALLDAGWRVAITHGNGPQVGALALQQEEAGSGVPAQPLFAVGAMTQGQLGSLLAMALDEVCGGAVPVVSVVTHVIVDPDPAAAATKPIGPFYGRDRARAFADLRGWEVVDDAGRGWRRVVASPEPGAIVEAGAVRALVESGHLVIACGGGGIPVIRRGGRLEGVEAVIDKDLAAWRLAVDLEAGVLCLVTGVDCVCLDHGTPRERPIVEMSLGEAIELDRAGQFPPGSMGPKVAAAGRFVRDGGDLAVITSAEHVLDAVEGRHGTRIVAA
ncbi:MAG TPA: carbamate kinase [Candidatus Dormibacteraeota bacterium]|jgi:carbamate kinase|nr:carbamate kinase [Candidatus Dormibacteraeota bacterium]